ncbi:36137_t:CDS:1, partial [Gigaspora margarita]
HYAKIVIDSMSIPLIKKNSNKASSVRNDPNKFNLLLEELTNMLKNLSLRSEDNKQQKRHKNKQNHFEE